MRDTLSLRLITSPTQFQVINVNRFVLIYGIWILDAEGHAISLQRVSQLAGKEIPFKKVDILNVPELDEVFKAEKFDAVIHLAALKAVGESSQKPLEYYTNNVTGSINLITVRLRLFVFHISTFAVSALQKT